MKPFLYDPQKTDKTLRAALELIAADFPIKPAVRANTALRLDPAAAGPSFQFENGVAHVSGATAPQVLRALATLRGYSHDGKPPREHAETSRFTMLGLMQDVSRNAVLRVEAVEAYLRRIALMGMNTFMLYAEDTYEVPGYPMFGYMRGRYSQAEMKRIDAYAARLGVEVIPCIQTLGHLAQPLRWHAFADVRDTGDILLVDEPKTYKLIEAMFASTTACFRSRRIHVGMDEAHGIGQGRYKQRFGEKSGFEIMTRHLARVVELTERFGLRPMMWSDMWFRLGSKNNDYYDLKSEIPAKVARQIPAAMEQVYWDYYHADREFYVEWIRRHRAMGKEPIFAGGAWKWGMLWPNFDRTRLCTDAAMAACRAEGVREAFTTAWGDDGNEADGFANLPNIQRFADHGYHDAVTDQITQRGFRGSCGGDAAALEMAGRLDAVPGIVSIRDVYRINGWNIPRELKPLADADVNFEVNASKFLLWQDPVIGIYDAHIRGLPLAKHYARLSADLQKRLAGSGDRDALGHALRLSRVLELKAELGLELYNAYHARGAAKNRRLVRLRDSVLPELIKRVRALYAGHRLLWMHDHKANGWEVLEGRYATLMARLDTVRGRLDDLLRARVEQLEELEEKRQPTQPWPEGKIGWTGWHRGTYTATVSN